MKVWRKTNESDVPFGIDLRSFFLRTAGEAQNKPLVPPISARIHISSEITQLALRPSSRLRSRITSVCPRCGTCQVSHPTLTHKRPGSWLTRPWPESWARWYPPWDLAIEPAFVTCRIRPQYFTTVVDTKHEIDVLVSDNFQHITVHKVSLPN